MRLYKMPIKGYKNPCKLIFENVKKSIDLIMAAILQGYGWIECRFPHDGYTQEDFDGLLNLLATIKGKFLLSSFRNETLDKFVKRKGWHTFEVSMVCSMTNKTGKTRKKVEVFTANYPIKAPDK